MAILQITGTKQEIKTMLDLFNFMDTPDLYRVEHYVELHLHKENGTRKTEMLVVSSNVNLNDYETDEADNFVTSMLIGVYND